MPHSRTCPAWSWGGDRREERQAAVGCSGGRGWQVGGPGGVEESGRKGEEPPRIGSERLPPGKEHLWLSSWLYLNQMQSFVVSQIPRACFRVRWLFPFVLLSLGTSCEEVSLPFQSFPGERLRAHREVWQEGEAMDKGRARPEACSSYGAFIELLLPVRPWAGSSLVAHPAWIPYLPGVHL